MLAVESARVLRENQKPPGGAQGMSTVYLIDGYNLLYAMGVLLHGRTGSPGLENARLRLLDMLHAAHGDESNQVTVVFDAAKAPLRALAEHDYQGLHVRFAVAEKEADALIGQAAVLAMSGFGAARRRGSSAITSAAPHPDRVWSA